MNTTIIDLIFKSIKPWGGWGHQNSQLELASMALECQEAKVIDWYKLEKLWYMQRDATRISKGLFSRTPKGFKHSEMANSHDNWIGIAVLSYLFDRGETAKEILDHGLWLKVFWLTGFNPKNKYLPDSEWLIRPENMAIMKLAAGRNINKIEKFFLIASLLWSRSWNVKRVRLLFLKRILWKRDLVEICLKELGTKHEKRYFAKGNPSWSVDIFQRIWAQQK